MKHFFDNDHSFLAGCVGVSLVLAGGGVLGFGLLTAGYGISMIRGW